MIHLRFTATAAKRALRLSPLVLFAAALLSIAASTFSQDRYTFSTSPNSVYSYTYSGCVTTPIAIANNRVAAYEIARENELENASYNYSVISNYQKNLGDNVTEKVLETGPSALLYEILSPEQMTAFLDHEERLQTDFLARNEALREELVDSGYSGLILAAMENDLPTVQAYLASGADPNRFTSDGLSALRRAAINNNPEMLRALINAGADVNLTIPGGRNAMMDAVTFGSTDAARVLVEYGADPNFRDDPDNPFSGMLSAAARNGDTEIVRLLLDAGADATGIVGEFALVNAIEFGDREMEQMLIDAGANADTTQVNERRSLFDLGRRLGLIDD